MPVGKINILLVCWVYRSIGRALSNAVGFRVVHVVGCQTCSAVVPGVITRFRVFVFLRRCYCLRGGKLLVAKVWFAHDRLDSAPETIIVRRQVEAGS